jgi:hypothetical protein
MNAACTPNGAAMRFVPGSGAIICLASDRCGLRPSVLAAGFLPAVPHSAAPPYALILSIRLYGSARLTVRAMVARSFSAASVKRKNPAEGSNRSAGC